MGTNSLKLNLEEKPLIGMIHLPSLTGSITDLEERTRILEDARQDMKILSSTGFNAILVENYGDRPFPKYRLDDARFLVFSYIVSRLISEVKIPLGINILRNACDQALTLATVTGASFIRCNVWEGAYITDQGIIEGVAYQVQKRKTELKSYVKILADIHVKHSTSLGQFTLGEAAQNALIRGKAEAIIVTGRSTGKPISPSELRELALNSNIKPILGSGLNFENIPSFFPYLSGAIVGTAIKKNPKDLFTAVDPVKSKRIAQRWISMKNG
ncbi:MAG: BtpA/SgcQ family protein [Candidatus Thorarchaeota archaeon]